MAEYTELIELVRAAYELDPVIPFEPKNAPKGKGGAGDLPGVKLCPHLDAIRKTARMLEVEFRTPGSKRCFCGILTLADGARVSFAACHFLRSLIDGELEGLEGVKKDFAKKKAEAEAKAEERFQQAMTTYEAEEEARRNALVNYWDLSKKEQVEVQRNVGKSFPPPKKRDANPTELFSTVAIPREFVKASEALGDIGGEPGKATSVRNLYCPLVGRILV